VDKWGKVGLGSKNLRGEGSSLKGGRVWKKEVGRRSSRGRRERTCGKKMAGELLKKRAERGKGRVEEPLVKIRGEDGKKTEDDKATQNEAKSCNLKKRQEKKGKWGLVK